jgi:RNA polymerase sigma factor (sigma-70 family)
MMINNVNEKLLEEYVPLIRHIAKNTCCSSNALDIDDLCQVGKMALLNAVTAYDASYNTNIKSFILKSVRRAIYNEAAKFLGIFTVDHRTTELAAKINRLVNSGKTDTEISNIMKLDPCYVQDLRLLYKQNQSELLDDSCVANDTEINFLDIINLVVKDEIDRAILHNRILNKKSVKELSKQLGISSKHIYERETCLRIRIRKIIEE